MRLCPCGFTNKDSRKEMIFKCPEKSALSLQSMKGKTIMHLRKGNDK
jgi:hypothetical protein